MPAGYGVRSVIVAVRFAGHESVCSGGAMAVGVGLCIHDPSEPPGVLRPMHALVDMS